ncbi:hypothetical protein CYLTODRAFT_121080 [Cylindrobasidium torrendii FP15055 ss-10]|uniref:Uncharacterized protein n=1 Tax=Cylindrobasidium torrendii FP15055 ss-10 TaxID=1314674 RepID=A0A0D7B061_9AGAR|nr:hypothetical protein CYLTODRAFT_121080 [Cylindrobasidium torrendii FP15055 ss-10]
MAHHDNFGDLHRRMVHVNRQALGGIFGGETESSAHHPLLRRPRRLLAQARPAARPRPPAARPRRPHRRRLHHPLKPPPLLPLQLPRPLPNKSLSRAPVQPPESLAQRLTMAQRPASPALHRHRRQPRMIQAT